MNITSIQTMSDYERALTKVESLWEAGANTPESVELDNIVNLIETFESEHYPIDAPNPIEAIKFRLAQQGLHESVLLDVIGSQKTISEVLNRQRKLSINMIIRLHTLLSIPIKTLLSDYELAK